MAYEAMFATWGQTGEGESMAATRRKLEVAATV
jgi:hypothetical protein